MSIRVDTGVQLFSTRWKHDESGASCFIEQLAEPPFWRVVAIGRSRRKKGDSYSKEIGRKVSLTKAIANWPREVRRLFWKAYFDRNLAAFKKALEEREGI